MGTVKCSIEIYQITPLFLLLWYGKDNYNHFIIFRYTQVLTIDHEREVVFLLFNQKKIIF